MYWVSQSSADARSSSLSVPSSLISFTEITWASGAVNRMSPARNVAWPQKPWNSPVSGAVSGSGRPNEGSRTGSTQKGRSASWGNQVCGLTPLSSTTTTGGEPAGGHGGAGGMSAAGTWVHETVPCPDFSPLALSGTVATRSSSVAPSATVWTQ